MASTFNLSNAAANAIVNGVSFGPLFNSGFLNIYSGTQPANANTALSGNTLLASLPFSATAFGAATNGVIVANTITAEAAVASGTAVFYRAYKTDGTTAICDGSVATSGADLNLSSISISLGGTVSISSLTFTQPET